MPASSLSLPPFSLTLLVALGGAAGAALRFWTSWLLDDLSAQARWAPYVATSAVNLVGCLAIGLLMATSLGSAPLADPRKTLLIVGLLGGFTTFSAFGLETVRLAQRTGLTEAALYGLGQVLLGACAVAVGLWIGDRLL